jgi:chaperonin cofactor prefoldin
MTRSAELSGAQSGAGDLRQILQEQLAEALAGLASRNEAPDIHGARKCIKAARATLRLLRPAIGHERYARENKALRDVGRVLAPARDAASLAAALGELRHKVKTRKARRGSRQFAMELRRQAERLEHRVARRGQARARSRLQAIDARIDQLPITESGWRLICEALVRSYRRARRQGRSGHSRGTTPGLHEWRKLSKYLYIQLQIAMPSAQGGLAATGRRLHKLVDKLGEDHDLAQLRELTLRRSGASNSGHLKELRAVIDKRRRKLRRRAQVVGRKAYAKRPKRFARRLRRSVKRAARQGKSDQALN